MRAPGCKPPKLGWYMDILDMAKNLCLVLSCSYKQNCRVSWLVKEIVSTVWPLINLPIVWVTLVIIATVASVLGILQKQLLLIKKAASDMVRLTLQFLHINTEEMSIPSLLASWASWTPPLDTEHSKVHGSLRSQFPESGSEKWKRV